MATALNHPTSLPHIGHLYSTVLADTLRRWYEFTGREALLSTGTDEHGQKIQEAAAKNKTTPKVFCDRISGHFKDLFDSANISYTDFIRTTDPRHYEAVSALWTRLVDRGYIYKGHHEGWYSVSDESFYAETQVEEVVGEDGSKYMVSKESGQRVVWTKEENYKFRLSMMKDRLVEWMTSNPDVIIPKNQYNQILATLTDSPDSLQDLSVSRLRSRLQWGIPVPGDEEHVIYVWLDALTNYLTVTGFPWDTPERAAKKGAWPAAWHVVGKDIIKFHAIYWPAFLLAAGLEPPRRILSHAHWLMGNTKMSKSRGNVVDPVALLNKFGVDPVRYFLVRNGGIAEDAEFSLDTVHARYKKDLAGQLGNLVMRCAAPRVNPTMEAPLTPGTITDAEKELIDKLESLPDQYADHFSTADFSRALEIAFDTISLANTYWQHTQPWTLTSSDPDRLRTILYFAFETVRVVALLVAPVMPAKMEKVLDVVGVEKGERG
ncbi:methionyl-tRNA synthetase, partial [Borealophlyctis nickersoniae]